MSTTSHPTDATGLVLPRPHWPDGPGSAGPLEPLRRFANTTNRENGADAWRTPRQLRDWLTSEDVGVVGPVTDGTLARFVALRDALWLGVTGGGYDAFAATAGTLAVRAGSGDGGVVLVPVATGADLVVARLALAVSAATADGTLGRLKSCDHCRWVFHDTSKNRRGRWCSMDACGGRLKARAYRSRRSAATAEGAP